MAETSETYLRSLLNEVRETVAAAKHFDDQTQTLMSQLESELEHALQEQDPRHLKEHSLIDSLQEAATRFEVEHPTTAQFLQRMSDGLSQLGI